MEHGLGDQEGSGGEGDNGQQPRVKLFTHPGHKELTGNPTSSSEDERPGGGGSE